MLEVVPTKSFKKDLKKYQHKKDIVKELYDVISILAKEEPLDPQKKDHSLIGDYVNYRECHVKNDVLLIYRVDKKNKQPLFGEIWVTLRDFLITVKVNLEINDLQLISL